MKNYKKKPSKLLQIRLSEKEHEDVVEFIKKFNITQREWITTVCNHLAEKTVIRDNYFWYDDKHYAYENSDKWDKKITDESVCEICGTRGKPGQYGHSLSRHHHDGYSGENAFKTHMVCSTHHGMAHTAMRQGKSWNLFISELNRK